MLPFLDVLMTLTIKISAEKTRMGSSYYFMVFFPKEKSLIGPNFVPEKLIWSHETSNAKGESINSTSNRSVSVKTRDSCGSIGSASRDREGHQRTSVCF